MNLSPDSPIQPPHFGVAPHPSARIIAAFGICVKEVSSPKPLDHYPCRFGAFVDVAIVTFPRGPVGFARRLGYRRLNAVNRPREGDGLQYMEVKLAGREYQRGNQVEDSGRAVFIGLK